MDLLGDEKPKKGCKPDYKGLIKTDNGNINLALWINETHDGQKYVSVTYTGRCNLYKFNEKCLQQ